MDACVMGKLTEKAYWNSVYEPGVIEQERPSWKRRLKSLIKKSLAPTSVGEVLEYRHSYTEYFLWDVVYQRYLPKAQGAKVLEVGSAPGRHLVILNQTFGFIPYGVEYSESGVELNRELFTLHNINPDNVIHADFLSTEFHERYKGYFDIVVSRGFIEHFTDVEDVIEKHIDLLAKGGYLIVSIPNLRGANYILMRLFHRELIPMHNLDIMQKDKFSKLFDREGLLTLFCDYYGVFDFGTFSAERDSQLHYVLAFCDKLQLILNVAFRLLFRDKGAQSGLFSPHLIFIGMKKG
jgi:SAM-dependent methyltransferase